jgi:hypothetical protein
LERKTLSLCACAVNPIVAIEDLCIRHKSAYQTYKKSMPEGSVCIPIPEWIRQRLQGELARPESYAELDRQTSEQSSERDEYIEKMRAGLAAAILTIDHLLGPNWFRADPGDVAGIQTCFDGLDAYQQMTSAGVSPPPNRVLNFINQRVKLDGYQGDGITDICGCADVIEDGNQLCHFHRQHYFAYRQKADPKTMLRVQQWALKRMSAISMWKTKGAVR